MALNLQFLVLVIEDMPEPEEADGDGVLVVEPVGVCAVDNEQVVPVPSLDEGFCDAQTFAGYFTGRVK